MEYGNVQTLPVRPVFVRRPTRAGRDDPRRSEFECRWTGNPATLQDIILAGVDWGPFEVTCHRHAWIEDRCVCSVHYTGPMRERPHLMASFWYVMERQTFYLGRRHKPAGPQKRHAHDYVLG